MPFDLASARKEASDEQIATYLGQKLGYDVASAIKEGATYSQIAEYLSTKDRPPQNKKEEKGYFARVGEDWSRRYNEYAAEEEKASKQGFIDRAIGFPKRSFVTAANAMGAVSDPLTEGIKSAYQTVVPDKMQRVIEHNMQTSGSVAGLRKLGELAQEYPQTADFVGKAMDIASFPAAVMGYKAIGEAAKAGLGKLVPKNLPNRIYDSALKLKSPGLGEAKRSIKEVQEITEEGLKRGALPKMDATFGGKKGINQLYDAVSEIDDTVKNAISAGAQQGKVVNTQTVIESLHDLRNKFLHQANPVDDVNAIDTVIRNFTMHGQEIPLDLAHEIKKNTYLQLKKKYGQMMSATVEGEKGLARGLKDEIYSNLVTDYPQLAALGREEGSILKLVDALENTYRRTHKLNMVPLQGSVNAAAAAAHGSIPGAIGAGLTTLLDMPLPKARLAIALYNAKNAKIKSLAHTKLLGIKLGEEQLQEQP